FKIERSTNGTSWAQVGTVGAGVTLFNDTDLLAGTQYTYRVRATNAVGDSAYSATASATTQVTPTAPDAPTNLGASATSDTT
ncbi:fibronectin type III domain-containing protein, partial [Escherichia coli]|uniref:fibronectin type III domain-containing protein n=1 Tax=Escherichia coli TaxID=562 RepID=UPI0028DD60B8